jgi:thiamine biosynthesis lipoprotein
MGTRVELVIHGDHNADLQAAGEAALYEIALWHTKLSRFASDSDLAFIAREAHTRPVRLDPDLFELLVMCDAVRVATGGAFDVRVAESMDMIRAGDEPKASLNAAPEMVLNAAERTLHAPGATPLRLDLGGVAKGFALDRAVAILLEAGVTNALIHAGTSSITAIGPGPHGQGWRVRVAGDEASAMHTQPESPDASALEPHFDITDITLRDQAMSVSVSAGRGAVGSDEAASSVSRPGAHILDPRTGALVATRRTAVVLAPLAADAGARCEAWSTSLAVLGIGANPPEDLTTFLREAGRPWRELRQPRDRRSRLVCDPCPNRA